ncbi:MAG TPA: ABC transporter ATP-binding protein [Methanotrichaceae archaeon]|nr:ABC transporter ATP-binding protein [Methanotrichaceae archaeon]
MADEILSVQKVSKRFGGLMAVDGCDLSVIEGSIVGLIGPNGAGKSTLFEMVSGFLSPSSGRILFQGREITGLPAHEIARAGIIRTFQIPKALNRMTVLDNLMLSPQNQSGETIWNAAFRLYRVRSEEKKIREKAAQILDFFSLQRMRDEYAGSLSGGQKKLLEMARSLMADPKLLLLDEPFAGVNPSLSLTLIKRIKELRDGGLTIMIIEHGIPYVVELSDEIYVLNKGSVMAHGSPEQVISDKKVLDAYLGEGR